MSQITKATVAPLGIPRAQLRIDGINVGARRAELQRPGVFPIGTLLVGRTPSRSSLAVTPGSTADPAMQAGAEPWLLASQR